MPALFDPTLLAQNFVPVLSPALTLLQM